jgi:AcrR family transcriptional regulator
MAVIEPIGKREKTKATNRQAILVAARRVFAQLGYDAATVRDIIRGTDLASGTFYNYFRSKEEVYEALADDSAARFRPILRHARDVAEGFED